MSEHQSRIMSLVADVWGALGNDEKDSELDFKNMFRDLFSLTWEKLPLDSEKGSALATASCIPLWEMTNCVSSTFSSLSTVPKAKMVQLLTAVYPKSKDRRSSYQQLTRHTQGSNASVPLSTESNPATEFGQLQRLPANLQAVLEGITCEGASSDSDFNTSSSKVSAGVKALVERILPFSVIFWERKAGAILVKCGEESAVAVEALMSIVWRCLVLAELESIPEKRQLVQYLTSSGWASKVVGQFGQRFTHASLFQPLTTMCTICLSLNPMTTSVSADNVPLFDPHIVSSVLHRDIVLAEVRDQICAARSAKVRKAKTSFPLTATGEQAHERAVGKLTQDIPDEIDFMGTSSSCRDCDSVTLVCRDALFSVLSTRKVPAETGMSATHEVLFSRKRSRSGVPLPDGPSLTPVASSMLDVLSDEKKKERNTLERLALAWRAK